MKKLIVDHKNQRLLSKMFIQKTYAGGECNLFKFEIIIFFKQSLRVLKSLKPDTK